MLVPEVVRRKAINVGAQSWLDQLPALIADLAREWSLQIGPIYDGGTEAFVAEVTRHDGSAAVLKVLIPRDGVLDRHEATALRLAAGDGCARLLDADESRGVLLLEKLGPSLFDLRVPVEQRWEILCGTAQRLWRPAPDCGLPTGAEKGRRLIDFITRTWEELGRPCAESAVEHAIRCAERRIAAHDDERALLVHGDIHQWNALQAGASFKLIDPDGLLAELEYDLGVIMREDPLDFPEGDMHARSRLLAHATGLDETAIWEWGAVERVSTGLLCVRDGLQPVASQMLAAAENAARER
jgi:streptomycin 6-kinase